MALQNCKRCGKLIGDTPSGYCDTCKSTDPAYSNLHKVKDYLYDNPNSNMTVVSRHTGVSISEITRFIRDGAIIEISGVSAIHEERCACGKPLEGNQKVCKDCRREAEKTAERVMKSLARKIPEPDAGTPVPKAKAEFFTKHK